jgi:hypothetical protein
MIVSTTKEARDLIALEAPDWIPDTAHLLDQIEEDLDEVQLHTESLTQDGDYALSAGCLLVRGDLVVSGRLTDGAAPGQLALIVLGDLSCQQLEITGALVVTGDVVVDEHVYVNSGNDYAFIVGGALRAKIFVEHGTCSAAGKIKTPAAFPLLNVVRCGERGTVPKKTREQLEDYLSASTIHPSVVARLRELLG